MNKIVKEVIQNEKARRKALKEELFAEREIIASKILSEAHEVITQLRCTHLLETCTEKIEVPVEKIIKVEVPVEKIVKVEVPVEKIVEVEKIVKVKDESEILKYKKTIETLNKQIEVLKNTIAAIQDKQSNSFNKTAIKQETNKVVIKQEENKIVSKQEEKKGVEKDIKKEQGFFVKKLNVRMKSSHVNMYQTNKCYLIASERNDAITWITDEELSDSYKKQVEETLIKDYNLMPDRIKTSPVVIEHKGSYMARVHAENNVGYNFSNKDILSGFVKLDNEFYLYVFTPAYGKVRIDSLSLKVSGSLYTFDCKSKEQMLIKERITGMVMKLYEEYVSKCNELIEKDKKTAANSNLNKAFSIREQQRAAFANAMNNKQSINNNFNKVNNVSSVNSLNTVNSNSKITSRALQEAADLF